MPNLFTIYSLYVHLLQKWTGFEIMPAPIRSLPPPSKKRRIHQDSTLTQSVVQLETDLTSAVSKNASLNPLADLLDLTLKSNGPQDTSKAIYALYRVFVLIITHDKLGLGGDDAAKIVKAWLWERLNTYVDYLGGVLQDEEKTLRVSSILYSSRKNVFNISLRLLPSKFYSLCKSTFRQPIRNLRHLILSSTSPTSGKSCRFSSYVLHPHDRKQTHRIIRLPLTPMSCIFSMRHGSAYMMTYDGSSFVMPRTPIQMLTLPMTDTITLLVLSSTKPPTKPTLTSLPTSSRCSNG